MYVGMPESPLYTNKKGDDQEQGCGQVYKVLTGRFCLVNEQKALQKMQQMSSAAIVLGRAVCLNIAIGSYVAMEGSEEAIGRRV